MVVFGLLLLALAIVAVLDWIFAAPWADEDITAAAPDNVVPFHTDDTDYREWWV